MQTQEVKSTLSLLEANKKSGIGQHTIRAAIASGELAAIKLGQRKIRIRPIALENWLQLLERSGQK